MESSYFEDKLNSFFESKIKDISVRAVELRDIKKQKKVNKDAENGKKD